MRWVRALMAALYLDEAKGRNARGCEQGAVCKCVRLSVACGQRVRCEPSGQRVHDLRRRLQCGFVRINCATVTR